MVDENWLCAVLRYANKNPDLFPDVAEGYITVAENDAQDIVAYLNSFVPKSLCGCC